jgi:hypothetical protein
MYWQCAKPNPELKMVVNYRNFDLDLLTAARIVPLDAAAW